jgi:uncharacterized protein (TIGR02118 family)
MMKLVVMYPWPADPAHFKRHYIDRHLPLCRAIPGAIRAFYTFEPKTVQSASRWFCIYEAEYADEDALNAALATPEARAAAADVQNCSAEPPVGLIYKLEPV